MTDRMITPPYLQPGDKIAIAATARKISEQEVQPAIDMFKKWGLEVVLAENLFNGYHQFAGTDRQRTIGLQECFDNPEVKAVICARGGYGTVRIIDAIDFTPFCKNPKWIIGYSDATVLHSHIHTNLGMETLHATMPVNFPSDGSENESTETLRKALFGEKLSYSIKTGNLSRQGKATGILTGGNLSMIYSLLGSPSDIDTEGKILFIEDLDEYLYHIDRMMMNLKRGGKLAHLAALIVGGMNKMNDNTIPFGKTAEEIIAEAVSGYSYPVCFGFPAGHLDDNLALILGRNIRLTIDGQQTAVEF